MELVHLQFCKFILGVHKKNSSLAVLGELGRFPITIDIYTNIIKYSVHLHKSSENSILHDGFVENCALSSAGNKKCWISKVKTLLNYLDTSINDHRDFYIFKLNVHLKSKFISNWKESISSPDQDQNIKGNKLGTYGSFKDNFMYEPYLDIVCN